MKLFDIFKKQSEEDKEKKRLSQEKSVLEKKQIKQDKLDNAKLKQIEKLNNKNNSIKIWRPRPTDVVKGFSRSEIIVSKTDTRGNITYGNQIFISMSGYTQDELLGQPHNIIRHPDMPQLIFKALWDAVSNGSEINAYVVNLAKNGSKYWVFANVTPSFDTRGNIIGYYSVRRKPSENALKIIVPFYEQLKKAEAIGGMHESMGLLIKLLKTHNMDYDELILHLQYKI